MTMLSTASQPKKGRRASMIPMGSTTNVRRGSFPVDQAVNNASSVELLMERKNFKLQQIYNLFQYKSIYLYSAEAVKTLRENERLQARSDDIIVSGYLKSGTTWTQAIVQLILYDQMSPIRAWGMDNSDKWSPLHRVRKAVIDSRPSTRLIKSHVPRDLLPVSILETNCKIIYVYRNVKDVMVSLFYMSKGLWEYQHTSPHDNFEHFVEKFVTGQIVFGPYFQHLASFWPHRHDANILLISYESILKDPQAMIKKLAAFMGKPISSKRVAKIVQASSFEEMKKHDTTQNDDNTWKFLRHGKSGSWQSHFTPELLQKVEAWIQSNLEVEELCGFRFDD